MRLVNWLTDTLLPHLKWLEKYVIGSGLAPSIKQYLNKSIRLMFITVIASLTTQVPLYTFIFKQAISASILLSLTISFVAVPSIAFLLMVLIPPIMYRDRGFKLEARIPRLALFLSSILASGGGLIRALLDLYEFKDMLHFKVELEIIRNGIALGKDAGEVLNYVASITPSRSLATLLITLSNAERSGRNILPVISHLLDTYLIELRSRIEEAINYMGILTEAFIVISLIFPLIISTFAAATALMPVTPLNPYTLLSLTSFIMVPVSAIMYYIAIDYVASGVQI